MLHDMEQFRPAHVIEQDAALAVAFCNGDADAIRAMVDRFGSPVFTVASHLSGDRQWAGDVARDVFVRAWHVADDFDAGGDFAPWLSGLTRAAVAERQGVSPEAVELVWSLRVALDSLEADERTVMKRRHLSGQSDADIASHLALDVDVVIGRLERADWRLGHRLASSGSPSLDGADLDGELFVLLAEPAIWEQPPADLADRVIDAIRADAGFEPADPDVAPSGPQAVDRQRGWVRPALLGALAALIVLFVGVVGLSVLTGSPERDTFSVDLISTGEIADVSGDIDVTTLDFGLRIDLRASGLSRRVDGAFYQAWVGTVDGDLIPVGSFIAGDGITLSAGVDVDRADSFLITLEQAAPGNDVEQTSSDVVVAARRSAGDRPFRASDQCETAARSASLTAAAPAGPINTV